MLDGIDQVPVSSSSDESKIEQIKAEAYFLRAFSYTNLMRSYGGLVLSDKKNSLDEDFTTQTRASLQEQLILFGRY